MDCNKKKGDQTPEEAGMTLNQKDNSYMWDSILPETKDVVKVISLLHPEKGIIYCEQAMKILRIDGGFNPEHAEVVRKAITKKHDVTTYKDLFLVTAIKKRSKEEADSLWHQIVNAIVENRSLFHTDRFLQMMGRTERLNCPICEFEKENSVKLTTIKPHQSTLNHKILSCSEGIEPKLDVSYAKSIIKRLESNTYNFKSFREHYAIKLHNLCAEVENDLDPEGNPITKWQN